MNEDSLLEKQSKVKLSLLLVLLRIILIPGIKTKLFINLKHQNDKFQ